jgi:hypothetical protein
MEIPKRNYGCSLCLQARGNWSDAEYFEKGVDRLEEKVRISSGGDHYGRWIFKFFLNWNAS